MPDIDPYHPVNTFFGLSYSAYYCVPRLVLETMPTAWQQEFVRLIQMMPDTPTYECRIREDDGRYRADELADYRRGQVPEEMRAQILQRCTIIGDKDR